MILKFFFNVIQQYKVGLSWWNLMSIEENYEILFLLTEFVDFIVLIQRTFNE